MLVTIRVSSSISKLKIIRKRKPPVTHRRQVAWWPPCCNYKIMKIYNYGGWRGWYSAGYTMAFVYLWFTQGLDLTLIAMRWKSVAWAVHSYYRIDWWHHFVPKSEVPKTTNFCSITLFKWRLELLITTLFKAFADLRHYVRTWAEAWNKVLKNNSRPDLNNLFFNTPRCC